MKVEVGIVYQITNCKNGKIYIGCTTQNFGVRISQHIRSVGSIKTDLYNDMAANIKDFCFQILEDGIPSSDLKKRESQWIDKLQSSITGYNQVVVSGNERLINHQVWEIRDYIMTTNLKFSQIADYYNISDSLVADINLGRAWLDESLTYPLRRQTVKRKHLTEEDIDQIYNLLRDPSLTFKQIADKFGWSSEAVLRKINNGTYKNSPLPKESYPIRAVDSRKGRRPKDNGMF